MEVTRRIEIEHTIVRKLIRTAKAQGWACTRVDNGGGWEKVYTEHEAMEEAFAADDASLYFIKTTDDGDLVRAVVYIVLGNDGCDVIADHSETAAGGWNDLMEAVSKYADSFEDECYR
jgi:hypothetical protein